MHPPSFRRVTIRAFRFSPFRQLDLPIYGIQDIYLISRKFSDLQHICPSSREQAIRSSNEKSGDDVIRKLYRLEASNGKSTSQSDENEIVVTLEKKYFLIQHESFQPNTQPEKVLYFNAACCFQFIAGEFCSIFD